MSQQKKKSVARPKRPEAFKNEALAPAEQVGVAKAAKELGVYESQIYQWRSKAAAVADLSEHENELLTESAKQKRELARLKEEVEILKKAAAYFAKHQS